MAGSASPGFTHLDSGVQVVLKRIAGLTNEGYLDEDWRFQVAPMEEFGSESTHAWSDYVTVERGMFSREGGVELMSISFQSLIVDYNPTWASWVGVNDDSWSDPQAAGEELRELQREGGPFRLVAWNQGMWDNPDYDLAVTLRSVSVSEKAGEPDARYFDLQFMEYRQQLLERRAYGHQGHSLPMWVVVLNNGIVAEDGGAEHKIGTPNKHATLRHLAKHFYGSSAKWQGIANTNGLEIAADAPLSKLVTAARPWRRLTIPKPKH
jgi:hypothetical protein